MLQLYFSTWQKAFTWKGRASRKEYWTFTLISVAAGIALFTASLVLKNKLLLLVYMLGCIAFIVPSISATIRRLHDINLSGYWYLGAVILLLVPELFRGLSRDDLNMNYLYIGTSSLINISFLVAMLWKGNPGDNKYGLHPSLQPAQAPTPEQYQAQIEASRNVE